MYEIFAQLCKQHGVTPYKVSKETGVSQPTLSEWKKGTYTPKQDKLQKIADYFGVTLDYLMGNTPAAEQTPPETQKAPTLNKKDERDIAKTLEQLRENSELPNTSEKKQRPIRSLARLEENDLTEAEDEQVSDFISFLLSKRDKKKDI